MYAFSWSYRIFVPEYKKIMKMNTFKRVLPDVIAVVFFVIISFVYFYPAVTEGRILSQHDSVAGIGAGQEQKEYMERTGERTRWTNSIFSQKMNTFNRGLSRLKTSNKYGMNFSIINDSCCGLNRIFQIFSSI